jgi:hypothetical protein
MAKPDDSDLTSGDGAVLIEIVCQSAPITPEARERARKRAQQQRQLGRESVPAPKHIPPASKPTDPPE